MEGVFHRPRKRPRAHDTLQVRPVIESLECRDLLAGASHVAFAAGIAPPLASRLRAQTYHQSIQIADFGGVEVGRNLWTIRGTVVADDLTGVTVQLSGLPSLRGVSVGVDEYGFFSITVQLAPGESGTATAQATDQWGDVSNLARTPVYPTASYNYLDRHNS